MNNDIEPLINGNKDDNARIMGEIHANVRHMEQDIREIKQGIEKLHDRISNTSEQNRGLFVSKDEFRPVKNTVYGMIGAILLSVLGMIMYFVGLGR